jgi:hypothetical protein
MVEIQTLGSDVTSDAADEWESLGSTER